MQWLAVVSQPGSLLPGLALRKMPVRKALGVKAERSTENLPTNIGFLE